MQNYILRIIDANSDRISEGLRFLEEIARFILCDPFLSNQLKNLRHNLIETTTRIGIELLSGRNSVTDVGANMQISMPLQNITSLAMANAKRVEQGLRVLEEIAKLPEARPILNSKYYQKTRFTMYEIERRLLSALFRREKASILTGLYVILDNQTLGNKDILQAAEQVIKGGARIIQLRDKCSEKGQLLGIAQKIKKLCKNSSALFIINDHLDIALACDADGLHIGQDDLPVSIARKYLNIDKIIGCSINTVRQAQNAITRGADYIAVGSIFPTISKSEAKVVGLTRLRELRKHISAPIIAIGGINSDNITSVISAGADSVAVISAILAQKNIEESTRQLVKQVAKKREYNSKAGKDC